MQDERTLENFLEALGSSAPAPGGGAASAVAGALAAALAEMVGQLTVGRAKFASVEEPMRQLIEQLRQARADLLALVAADEQAFAAVSAAYKQPRASDEEKAARDTAIQDALRRAMEPPLAIMRRTCDVLSLAQEVAASGNPTVASDAGCAALIGQAAVRAAGLNVLANIALLKDEAAVATARTAMTRYEEQAESLLDRTLAAVHVRMGV